MLKEALIMTVDAGASMDENFSDIASRLKISLECVKLTLQQKLFQNFNHDFGFCIFGDQQSDDGNTLILHQLAKPNLDLVRKVEKMSEMKLGNNAEGGDIFMAIERAAILLVEHCKLKKMGKRIFLFTNGSGPTNLREVVTLGKYLSRNDIRVNVIAIDFMTSYDLSQNTLDNETLSENQRMNANLLIDLKRAEQENVQIFPASIAIELYKRFRLKEVNPVAIYRGPLQIALNLQLNCQTYKAVRRDRLKSILKYDQTQPFNSQITKDIKNEFHFVVVGDESGVPVDRDNQANAYQYGPHLVPISEILQQDTKLCEEKNFRILGFVSKKNVPCQAFMNEVDIVIPAKDPFSRKLFTSLVYSMALMDTYGIARYLPRNSKAGANPRMVALIPYRSPEKELLYLIDLPTVEDIRDYPFNSLKKATISQRKLISKLVSEMSLYSGDIQEVKVESTFNYMKQYFYQTLFHRVLKCEGQIPPLDENIRRYIQPEQVKFSLTKPIMKDIRTEFKLVRKELARDKAKNKHTTIWKDMLLSTEEESHRINQISDEFQEIRTKAFTFQEQNEDEFDPKNPITSFRKMLSNNKKDLVDVALREMSSYADSKASIITDEDELREVVECLSQMRRGCQEQQEPEFWDNYLELILRKGGKVPERLKQHGLGFLRKSNADLYKASREDLHPLEFVYDDLD